jgi:WD40 repeat protein
MSESGLLTSSIEYGVVARSLPLTGKVLKGYLNAAGTSFGIGNPNVEFTPNVSACSLTSDGGTAKAFWGKHNGEVAVTTAARVMNPTPASPKLIRCKVEDQHDGVVNEIALDSVTSRFVSAGADGQVKLWDSKTVACLWSSERQHRSFVADPILKVSSALADGVIISALNSGDVLVWLSATEFLSNDLPTPISFIQHRITSPISKEQLSPQDTFPRLISLCVHRCSQTTAVLLLGYSDHPFFYRLIVNLTSGKYETTAFGDPSFGNNSAVEPVFATQPDDRSLVISGGNLGSIGIYDWDAPHTSSVTSARRCEADVAGAVTAIAWSSLVLATGYSYGTTVVWDALTLEPLRLFSFPMRPGRDVEIVSKIVIAKELLIMVVDNMVMSWKVGAVRSRHAPHKGKHASAKKNPLSKGQRTHVLISVRLLLTDEIRRAI